MKRLFEGIIIGIIIALSVKQVQAAYTYTRLNLAEDFNTGSMRTDQTNFPGHVYILWDEHEKTNCYVYAEGGISCLRSIN